MGLKAFALLAAAAATVVAQEYNITYAYLDGQMYAPVSIDSSDEC